MCHDIWTANPLLILLHDAPAVWLTQAARLPLEHQSSILRLVFSPLTTEARDIWIKDGHETLHRSSSPNSFATCRGSRTLARSLSLSNKSFDERATSDCELLTLCLQMRMSEKVIESCYLFAWKDLTLRSAPSYCNECEWMFERGGKTTERSRLLRETPFVR